MKKEKFFAICRQQSRSLLFVKVSIRREESLRVNRAGRCCQEFPGQLGKIWKLHGMISPQTLRICCAVLFNHALPDLDPDPAGYTVSGSGLDPDPERIRIRPDPVTLDPAWIRIRPDPKIVDPMHL